MKSVIRRLLESEVLEHPRVRWLLQSEAIENGGKPSMGWHAFMIVLVTVIFLGAIRVLNPLPLSFENELQFSFMMLIAVCGIHVSIWGFWGRRIWMAAVSQDQDQ